jgi:RimJ/RimL family protein N-acetyltransferase
MMQYLETKRLILREFKKEDIKNLHSLNSDPQVMQWLTNGVPTELSEVENRVNEVVLMAKRYQHKFGFWSVIEKESGEYLGWFHLKPDRNEPDNLKKVELGFRFFRKYWGNGFATEGSKSLIQKAFREFEVEEIFATAMKKNIASRKVLEKLGFKFSHEYYDDRFPIKEELAVYYTLKR